CTWAVTKLTRSTLDPAIRWIDLTAVSLLAGIGFTVSLLIAELTFTDSAAALTNAKLAILVASTAAAIAAGTVLAFRSRHYRRIEEAATEPDVAQTGEGATAGTPGAAGDPAPSTSADR
ncbi:Na+/H+ antiporter NhaA, partial [Tsukamurella pulmonis]